MHLSPHERFHPLALAFNAPCFSLARSTAQLDPRTGALLNLSSSASTLRRPLRVGVAKRASSRPPASERVVQRSSGQTHTSLYLRPCFPFVRSVPLSRSWGSEVDGRETTYLEEIRINPNMRGKGIGQWALNQLWNERELSVSVPRVRRGRHQLIATSLQRVDFIYSWPALLRDDRATLLDTSELAGEDSAKFGVRCDEHVDRVIKFFKRVRPPGTDCRGKFSQDIQGTWRRVGTTSFFCSARDATHRSRSVLAAEDAEFVPPQERTDSGAHSQQAFHDMLAQMGIPL